MESSGLVGVPVHDGWAKVFVSGDNDELAASFQVLQGLSLLRSEVVPAALSFG